MTSDVETADAATAKRNCLVCGHGQTEHVTVKGRCTGTGGLCQCHAYNPDEHPAERLARRAAAADGASG